MTIESIKAAFEALLDAGVAPPDRYTTDEGMAAGIETWRTLLADVSDEALLSAVAAYLRTPEGRFWPAPGQVLAHVPGSPAAADDADAAWVLVQQHVVRHGTWWPPGETWDWPGDAATRVRFRAAIDAAGGWERVCTASPPAHAAVRRAFLDAWRALARLPASSPLRKAIEAPPAPLALPGPSDDGGRVLRYRPRTAGEGAAEPNRPSMTPEQLAAAKERAHRYRAAILQALEETGGNAQAAVVLAKKRLAERDVAGGAP